MENSISQGGGQQGVIFHMLSRKILNAQKAILSIFRHFYFFPLCTPDPPLLPSSELNNENFLSIFGLLRGKNKNLLELPKCNFNDKKKMHIFNILRGRGANQHMENSIFFCVYFFKVSLPQLDNKIIASPTTTQSPFEQPTYCKLLLCKLFRQKLF